MTTVPLTGSKPNPTMRLRGFGFSHAHSQHGHGPGFPPATCVWLRPKLTFVCPGHARTGNGLPQLTASSGVVPPPRAEYAYLPAPANRQPRLAAVCIHDDIVRRVLAEPSQPLRRLDRVPRLVLVPACIRSMREYDPLRSERFDPNAHGLVVHHDRPLRLKRYPPENALPARRRLARLRHLRRNTRALEPSPVRIPLQPHRRERIDRRPIPKLTPSPRHAVPYLQVTPLLPPPPE